MSSRGKKQGSTLNSTTIEPTSLPAARSVRRVPMLTVAYHPDLDRIGDRALLDELVSKKRVALSRVEPSFESGEPLRDAHVSRDPVVISLDPGGVRFDCRNTSTRVFVNGEPVGPAHWLLFNQLEHGAIIELAGRIALVLHLDDGLSAPRHRYGLIGQSDSIRGLCEEIERAASHTAPVLIAGESGSGKELVARAIHDASARAREPFVSVNVAAIPESTAAAELFGHAKGAYTGAGAAHGGWFGRAEGGTLFLDEIGEAPSSLQPMLLRALEAREVQPVGAPGVRKVDVRVLTATDADLAAASASGRFRFPLFQRLSGHTVRVPPLRLRKSDIGLLLMHFIRRELEERGAEFPEPNDDAVGWLSAPIVLRALRYDWPGNVRELANFARELVLFSSNQPAARVGRSFDALLPKAREPAPSHGADDVPAPVATRESIDDELLLRTLREHGFRVAATARALSISKNTLYQLMERCPGIRKAKDLAADEIHTARARCDGDSARMSELLEVSERGLKLRMKELGID